MMQRPWASGTIDEWLPRSLRLCWGGDSGGSGFGGDGGGGGWGGDSGGGGWDASGGGMGNTGGGDWGSAGMYDASGFQGSGDLGAWAGTAYDASTAGTGAGGGGDWGSFGPTNYSGMDSPNPIFTDVAGPNPGVTTGGGDWGSAGAFSAAAADAGPAGAMTGAAQGAASGAGGGFWGDTGGGGGFFGNQGGGGGGYTGGGGGGGGKGGGGGSFGGFGTAGTSAGGKGGGPLGGSNMLSSVAGPAFADTAGSAGGKGSAGPVGGKGDADTSSLSDDAPTRSEAEVSSVSQADQDAPAESAPTADPDADAAPLGTPTTSDAAPAPEAGGGGGGGAPGGGGGGGGGGSAGAGKGGSEAGRAAPAETEAAPSAFGPQSLDTSTPDYQGAPYTSNYDQGPQSAAPSGVDLAGDQGTSFTFGDDWSAAPQGIDPGSEQYGTNAPAWAPNDADVFAAPDQAPNYGELFAAPGQESPGRWGDVPGTISNLISDLMSKGPEPQSLVPGFQSWMLNPGVTFPAAPAWAQNPPTPTNPLTTTPQWAQNPRAFEVFDPKADPQAQARIDAKSLWDVSTYLSAQNQTPLNTSVFNAITGALSGLRGSPFDQQALGEQGRAGQQTDLATQLGTQAISPAYAGPFAGPDVVGNRGENLASQLGIDQIGTNQTPSEFAPGQPGMTTFEGGPMSTGHTSFEGGPMSTGHTTFEGGPMSTGHTTFEGGPMSTGHTNFEGEPISSTGHTNFFEANPYADMLPAGDPSYPTSPDTAFSPGANPQDAPGYYISDTQPTAPAGEPTYDMTMESGPAGQQPTTDDARTPGSDPALSGYPADPGAVLGQPGEGQPGQPGQPGAPPGQGGPTYAQEAAANIAANAAANAAQSVAVSVPAQDAASQAAHAAALNNASPTEQAAAARDAAVQADPSTTPEQADAIYDATLAAATNPTLSAQPGQQQQAPPGPEQPGAPVGPQTTPQAPVAPSLIEMAQPGAQVAPQVQPTETQQTQPGVQPGLIDMQPPAAPPPASQPLPGVPGGQPGGQPGGGIKGTYDAPRWQGPTTADRYLSDVYDRTARKIDSGGDFTHKDPLAASRVGMGKLEYAIGGIDPDVKTIVEAMGKALDKANIPWTINAAYRDVFRQGITEGKVKASPTGSWHGGTDRVPHQPGRGPTALPNWPGYANVSGVQNRATPGQIKGGADAYGLGRALDVTGVGGNQNQVWNWIDQNGAKFGIHRPYSNDEPHIEPTGNFRELADKIRQGFDPLTGKYQTDNGKPDPNFARNQEARDRARREPPPGGWRGIGGDIGREARMPQLDIPRPPADIPPTVLQPPDIARPPADIPPPVAQPPAALPSPTMPLPPDQQPAPIAPAPAPFLSPPRAGRADPVLQARQALDIIKQSTAKLTTSAGQAEFNAAGVVAAKGMAAAGIPLDMARNLMTKSAYEGAEKVGYGPSSMGWNMMYKPAIDGGIAAALQGYQPAKPGEVQGPQGFQPDAPAPAPGRQGSFGDFQQFAGLSQSTGPASENYGRGTPALQQLSPIIAPPPPPNPNDWGKPQPAPPPLYTPDTPGMFNPFRGNEAALPGVTLAAARGRGAAGSPLFDLAPTYREGQAIPPKAGGPDVQDLTQEQQEMEELLGRPDSNYEDEIAPFAPRGDRSASLLDFLQNFNPISTAEARGRGRGGSYPVPPGSTRSNPHFTFYGPGPGGRMEGGFETSRPNQAGTNVPITLDMVRSAREQGRDLDVTLASDPSRYGETINVGKVTYVSPIDGKQYTLDNVRGFVHDTGSAFKGRPEKVDIAVSDYTGWSERAAGDQTALAHIGASPNAIVVAGPDAVGPQPDMPAAAVGPAATMPLRGLAKGGHVAEDEPVVVGEEGPEYFVPDRPGTVVPHMPQPGKGKNVDRWPKLPAAGYPGRYGGVEREIEWQTREAQNPIPSLIDMIDSGQLRLNPANWQRMISDPSLIQLGRSRIEDRRYLRDYEY